MNGPASMGDVPEEVMIEIFQYLSPKLLKIATLVCKRWNEIISQSPKVLKHYKLNLVPSPRNKIGEGTSINRKLSGLETNILSEPVVEFMTSHKLTHLELTKLIIVKQQLAKVLALADQATSLIFDDIKVDNVFMSNAVPPVEFSKLKQLKITNCDTDILSLVATTTLTDFTSVRDLCFSKTARNVSVDEVNLLVQQKDLKSLHLDMSFDELFFNRIEDFPFKLRKLTILYGIPSKLDDFLVRQKDSLEELRFWPLGRSSFSFSFDMPNLRSLKVARLSCPDPTPELSKLEHFSGVFAPSSQEETSRFLHLIRNVKSFETEGSLPIDNFHARLKKLESLSLATNFNYRPSNAHKIKELKFTRVWDNEQVFDKIIRRHSKTLEKLTIDMIDDTRFSRGLTTEAIKTCKKLKMLSVGCSTPLVPRMFRKIKFNHPWTLEVFYKKQDSGSCSRDIVHAWIKIVFRFPDDQALFDGQCTTWSDDLIREFSTVKDYGVNAFVNEYK